jgi:hypothetical protein
MIKLLRLTAFFGLLSPLFCPLAAAQMPGGNGIGRVPPQMGGTGATTGAVTVWGVPNAQPVPINCNQTGDTPVTITAPGVSYRLNNMVLVAESGSFTTAKLGLYTGPGQTGNTLVAQTALSGLTTTAPNTDGNLLAYTAPAVSVTARTLYFNVGTAQGGTCVINLYIGLTSLANG